MLLSASHVHQFSSYFDSSSDFEVLAALQQPGGLESIKAGPPAADGPASFLDLRYLLSLVNHCALVAVVNVGQEFQQKLADCDNKFDVAFNSCALELCTVVRAHTYAFMLTNFVAAVNSIEDKAVQAALSKLCAFWACSILQDDPVWAGLITMAQLGYMRTATCDLLNQLRPDAVTFVDAFEFPDRVLSSTIGRYDGNVYEALLESALKSPLNQTEPFEGYAEVLRPYLDLDYLKLKNTVPVAAKL